MSTVIEEAAAALESIGLRGVIYDGELQSLTKLAAALRTEASSAPRAPTYETPDFIVLSAVRYALGRATYIVEETVRWLETNWSRLNSTTQVLIQRDVQRGLDEGHAGMDIDRLAWERVVARPITPPGDRNEADAGEHG